MFNLFTKLRRAKALTRAREAYGLARAAYDDAVDRRDSRDKHVTFARLTVASTALLKAETASRDLARSSRGVPRTRATLAVKGR